MIDVLLDTHILLWSAYEPHRLSQRAWAILNDPNSRLIFSVVSIWEITIKRALGKPGFMADPARLREGLLKNGYVELPISSIHALAVGLLPSIHDDPFDRLLIAQGSVESCLLLTSDKKVYQYPGNILRV
jgi:PIN domain nuclease of toxin-antitoxin system